MNDGSFRSFGIVPAAGLSQRMGAHKLMLPYQGLTLIEHVLSQWAASRVHHTLVVLNSADDVMIDKCKATNVVCVIPEPAPREMKHSVQAGLTWIQQHMEPRANDAWMLAPADLPGLSSRIIDLVIDAYDPGDPKIVVPRHGDRRGHPAMFPWSLMHDVFELNEHQGVNRLLECHAVLDVPVGNSEILSDVDTPDDYQRSINGNP